MTTHHHAEPPGAQLSAWTVVKRGLRLRCPACGVGRLFDGYLKPRPACSNCAAPTGDIRADDGPAWATIILVGHLVSPSFFVFATASNEIARLAALGTIMALVLGLTFLFLPRMKGVFIALIWKTGATGDNPDLEDDQA